MMLPKYQDALYIDVSFARCTSSRELGLLCTGNTCGASAHLCRVRELSDKQRRGIQRKVKAEANYHEGHGGVHHESYLIMRTTKRQPLTDCARADEYVYTRRCALQCDAGEHEYGTNEQRRPPTQTVCQKRRKRETLENKHCKA